MSVFFEREERRTSWKWIAGGIAGMGLLAAVWLLFSSPEETRISGRGFDQSGLSGAPRAPRAVERRTGTGLNMVSGSLREGALTPAQLGAAELKPEPAAEAPPADPGVAAPGAAPGAPPRPAGPVKAADAREVAAAGIPTDANGLNRLGAQKGMLSAVVSKLLDHPRVLKAVLDNKLVVDALMNRETSKRNCSDPGALSSIISNPRSEPMARILPVITAALSRPEAASAMAGSEMAKRVLDCPSVKALSSNPAAVMSVAFSNPEVLKMASDPRLGVAIATNPQASGMFSNMKSSLGGQPQ